MTARLYLHEVPFKFLNSMNTYLCQFTLSYVNCLHSRLIPLPGAMYISMFILSILSLECTLQVQTGRAPSNYSAGENSNRAGRPVVSMLGETL